MKISCSSEENTHQRRTKHRREHGQIAGLDWGWDDGKCGTTDVRIMKAYISSCVFSCVTDVGRRSPPAITYHPRRCLSAHFVPSLHAPQPGLCVACREPIYFLVRWEPRFVIILIISIFNNNYTYISLMIPCLLMIIRSDIKFL